MPIGSTGIGGAGIGIGTPGIGGAGIEGGVAGSAPTIVGSATWTDNGDGTATVTFTTDVATYAGVDYGTAPATYTSSSFNYDGAGPALESTTNHTVEIPDPIAGGAEAAGTYYFRIWTPSGYITEEATGVITSGPDGLLLGQY